MSFDMMIHNHETYGQIRYFLSDRCTNVDKIREFNHLVQNKIQADEIIMFDSVLMEMSEIEENEVQIFIREHGHKNRQILAIVVRPAIELDWEMSQKGEFEFCGYDLVDMMSCISVITDCDTQFACIKYDKLNSYGLISSYREAVNTQLDLNEMYSEHSHAYCEIVEIWRRLLV